MQIFLFLFKLKCYSVGERIFKKIIMWTGWFNANTFRKKTAKNIFSTLCSFVTLGHEEESKYEKSLEKVWARVTKMAKFAKWWQSHPLILFILSIFLIFWLGFTPCKAEQPLRGMELQEKETQKDFSIQEICLERTYS